jgi:hypothetical protein
MRNPVFPLLPHIEGVGIQGKWPLMGTGPSSYLNWGAPWSSEANHLLSKRSGKIH